MITPKEGWDAPAKQEFNEAVSQLRSRPTPPKIAIAALVTVLAAASIVAFRRYQTNHISADFKLKATRALDSMDRLAERMYDGVLLYAPPELEAERDVQEATTAASSPKGKKLVEDMAAYLSAIGMDRSHHFMRIHNDRLRAENDQLDNEIAALKGQRKPHPSRYEVHEGLTSEDLENATTQQVCIDDLRRRLDGGSNPECIKRVLAEADRAVADSKAILDHK